MDRCRVCPWWAGYLLLDPIRRLFQNPAAILAPYVKLGMTDLEQGPGLGFFTLEIARRVGPGGRAIAVDVQPRMIQVLRRRADKAGLGARVEARCAAAKGMDADDLAGQIDLVFAFAVVHEMPSPARFFSEAAQTLAPNGQLLLTEPVGHVDDAFFAAELTAAEDAGLILVARPEIGKSHAALFRLEAV